VRDEDFSKYLPDYKNLDELKEHYSKGGLGDVTIKRFLDKVLQDRLAPIREKRKYYENHIEEVYNILKIGTENANKACNEVVKNVKSAMGINYFIDDTFLNSQKEKYNN
jgi:tryptophanyl-tRNA synthetase